MKESLLIFQILKNSNIEMHINVHEVVGFCILATSLTLEKEPSTDLDY